MDRDNGTGERRRTRLNDLDFQVGQAVSQAETGGYMGLDKGERGGKYWERDKWNEYIQRVKAQINKGSHSPELKAIAIAQVNALDAQKQGKPEFV